MTKKPLLLIKWKDHTSEGGWGDVEKFHGPGLCFSVGWLAKEDDEGITIIGDTSPPDQHGHESGRLQYILKSCIVKRTTLKYPALG